MEESNEKDKQGQKDRWIPVSDDAAKDEAVKRYGPAFYMPGDPRHDMQTTVAFYSCYEWLRDMNYLKPSRAIGEQTPVAWMSDSGKVVSASGKLRMEEAEHPVGIHYDIPLYRPPMSPEARDRAIEALAKLRNYFGENDKATHQHYLFSVADQALSALRGQTSGT